MENLYISQGRCWVLYVPLGGKELINYVYCIYSINKVTIQYFTTKYKNIQI